MGRLLLHRDNFKVKTLPRNPERDVVEIRRLWYDEGIRMTGLLRRYEPFGWTLEQIEDVVYYRSYLAVQEKDVVWSCREANY